MGMGLLTAGGKRPRCDRPHRRPHRGRHWATEPARSRTRSSTANPCIAQPSVLVKTPDDTSDAPAAAVPVIFVPPESVHAHLPFTASRYVASYSYRFDGDTGVWGRGGRSVDMLRKSERKPGDVIDTDGEAART